ncbi:hypothetical protein BH10PSE12_BH10PSE12_25560 [soil metagenome]
MEQWGDQRLALRMHALAHASAGKVEISGPTVGAFLSKIIISMLRECLSIISDF